MKKFSVLALAATALLTLNLTKAFAQDADEVMMDDETMSASDTAGMGEEAPTPAGGEESFEYTEEEY